MSLHHNRSLKKRANFDFDFDRSGLESSFIKKLRPFSVLLNAYSSLKVDPSHMSKLI